MVQEPQHIHELHLSCHPLAFCHFFCSREQEAGMGLAGELEVEVDVKSPADKFWRGISDSTELFPKIFPDQYKSIESVEGDGKTVGSVRLIRYAQGIPMVTFVKEKIEAIDETNKSVGYSVIDGDLLSFYKTFKAKLQVTPKGEGALVKWAIVYEKANEEVPEPNLIVDSAVKTFAGLDEHLLKN
uniref:MLP-like protein 423 n=1 Tax=Anthurium amnicola TaxID=1678845 RepID=A0A1D1ZGT8_9ARAE